jgi:hypothetical protein
MRLATAKVVMGVVALGVGAMVMMAGSKSSAAQPQPSIGPDPTSWRQLNSWEITTQEQALMTQKAASLANGASQDQVVNGKWRRFQNANGVISIWAPSSEPLNGSPPPTGVQTPSSNGTVPATNNATGGANGAGVPVDDGSSGDPANAPITGTDSGDDGSDDGSAGDAVPGGTDDGS